MFRKWEIDMKIGPALWEPPGKSMKTFRRRHGMRFYGLYVKKDKLGLLPFIDVV